MNENIKISSEVLNEIKNLQSKFQESIYKMGILHIEKLELDQRVSDFVEKEKSLKEEWSHLQKTEKNLLDTIVEKYGEGHLNMEDGTFVTTSTK